MSLRSLKEMSSDLRRREDAEDREQAERESGERVLHEWAADGVVHSIREDYYGRPQIVSTISGGEILGVPTFRERAFVGEILRLREQVRAARVAPLNTLRRRLIDAYNGRPPLSVMGILEQEIDRLQEAEESA